ncbi:MAG: hypothetical protein ABEN55_12030, partial [Bradymonadaceae bacterium]
MNDESVEIEDRTKNEDEDGLPSIEDIQVHPDDTFTMFHPQAGAIRLPARTFAEIKQQMNQKLLRRFQRMKHVEVKPETVEKVEQMANSVFASISRRLTPFFEMDCEANLETG